MVARKRKKKDWRNIVIVFLLLTVGVEFYFLYHSNESVRKFIGSSSQSQSHSRISVQAQSDFVPKSLPSKMEQSALLPSKVEESAPVVVPVTVKPTSKKPVVVPKKKSYVAIVIDDWGYSTRNCQYLDNIKEPISVAVLPNLPHSNDVMDCAHRAGKEIMLHLPMEAHNNSDEYPPDYLITTNMSPIKVDRLLSDILDKMPLVSGVNNHMGSKATENKVVISTVFKQLKHRGLFFMDSRVTSKSVCEPLAKQANLPFTARDVFLDNINEASAIKKEMASLVRLAKKRGRALAIGHDRALTLQVIEGYLPLLREQGIELVTVKDYINNP